MNTNNNLGSSETLREDSPHAFTAYVPYCPQHKKLDVEFLQWFVGFVEGDGSFIITETETSDGFRYSCAITQDDRALLARIRTELGFGVLGTVTANKSENNPEGTQYPQLRFDSRKAVIAILHIFAGNIRLNKVKERFEPWAQGVCRKFNLSMPQNPAGLASFPPRLDEAWLSGFFQAEGSFSAQQRTDKRLTLGYRVVLRPYVDQKGERELLEQLLELLPGNFQIRDKEKNYYRAWFTRASDEFARYFERFPVKGLKKISQSRWLRVYSRLRNKETVPLPEKGTKAHERFVRLIKRINF